MATALRDVPAAGHHPLAARVVLFFGHGGGVAYSSFTNEDLGRYRPPAAPTPDAPASPSPSPAPSSGPTG